MSFFKKTEVLIYIMCLQKVPIPQLFFILVPALFLFIIVMDTYNSM